jgi:hypothetical protein
MSITSPTPTCPFHKMLMRPPVGRKLAKNSDYFLCPHPGCIHRYQRKEGYITTKLPDPLHEFGLGWKIAKYVWR